MCFSLKFCDFSEPCQFCCSGGARCVYTHWHQGKTEKGQSPEYSKILWKNTIFNEHPVQRQTFYSFTYILIIVFYIEIIHYSWNNYSLLILFIFNKGTLYRVFIKYCVFSKDFRIFWTLVFLCFPLVSVCVRTPGR